MDQEPEVIESNIEATRGDLSRDLDALTDRVSPGRVMDRKVGSVKNKAASVKEKVMGSEIGCLEKRDCAGSGS